MALSFVSYTGNGTTTSFAVPFPYLSQADVFVTVGGSSAAFTWTNPALIHFTTAPASGAGILIKRSTNIATLDVVFTDGSTVQASDINTDALQGLYLAQEQADNISTVIAQGAAAEAAAISATAAAAAAEAAAVPMVGDSGSGGTAGLVPAPPSGSFAAKKFLSAGGTWITTPAVPMVGDSGSGGTAGLVPAPPAGSLAAKKFLSAGGSWLAPGTGIPSSFVFIENFGGAGDGTTDNSTPLANALASFGTGSGCVLFGQGVYKFVTAVTFAYTSTGTNAQSIALVGLGQQITQLLFPTTSGIIFNMATAQHTFHFRDLSFLCGTANTRTGLQVNQATPGGSVQQNDITRCTFQGNDGGVATNAWTTAISIVGVANVTIDTVVFNGNSSNQGTAITYIGAASGSFRWAIMLTITKSQFINLACGVLLQTWWQGVDISHCNFTNGVTGIVQVSGDTSGGLSELLISHCQFGLTGSAVTINSLISFVSVIGCLFLIPASVTAFFSNFGWEGGTFTGNGFEGTGSLSGQIAISLGPLSSFPAPTTITGNIFINLAAAMALQTGCTGVNIQSNGYHSVTTNIVGSATGNTFGGGST